MELIRHTKRDLIGLRNYSGVCHTCNSPVEYTGDFVGVIVERLPDGFCVVPIDRFTCPYCGTSMEIMAMYPNMDVTKELVKDGTS